MQELTETEKCQLAREIAADQYDREWPLRTTLGNLSREGFVSGWDAAMEYVRQQAQPKEGVLRSKVETGEYDRW